MRLLSIIVAAVGCAASAYAVEIPADQVSWRPMEGTPGYAGRQNTVPVFSAIPGPYAGFAAAAGLLGFDDYDSIVADPTFLLGEFTFVGGVATAGTIRVEFLDSQNVVANQFTVNLPAGNNIWTIGLAADPKDSTFLVPSFGVVRITSIASSTGAPASTGQWFLSTTVPSIGTQLTTFGSTAGGGSAAFSHRFELQQVPTPGALALVGMGGMLMARRRRA
jgi:hypothetical protein